MEFKYTYLQTEANAIEYAKEMLLKISDASIYKPQVTFSVQETKALIEEFTLSVQNSAKASLISFNKFIDLPSVRERRDRRERFDLKNVPVSTTTYTRTFFGVNQASNLMKITQQYQQYIDVYPTIDKNSFARSFDYWETKKLVWPDLYLAVYKAHNFALSSTSNERHIGIPASVFFGIKNFF